MKPKMILFTVIALCLMGGVGCDEKEVYVSDLFHTWKFQGFGNTTDNSFEKALPADCEVCYVLTFLKDGKFSGFTTTNEISGEYTLDGKNLRITNLAGTKVGELGTGYKYSDALILIERYEIVKNKLKLYYNQGQKYLLFTPSYRI